jgi:hypothetical protein
LAGRAGATGIVHRDFQWLDDTQGGYDTQPLPLQSCDATAVASRISFRNEKNTVFVENTILFSTGRNWRN